MAGGDAPLLHRHRGQRRVADDVARGVDVRLRRLEVLVDGDAPARVEREAGLVEPEGLRVAGAARRVEDLVDLEDLAALERDAQRPARHALDRFDGVAQHDLVPAALERRLHAGRHLAVEPAEQVAATLDDDDGRAERREQAGVLAADDAAAHDGQRGRDAIEVEDRVGVLDVGIVEGHARRAVRRAAGRDEE